MIDEIKRFFIDLGESTTYGASVTWAFNKLFPFIGQLSGALIVTGICTTVAFFLKRWLRKKFPQN